MYDVYALKQLSTSTTQRLYQKTIQSLVPAAGEALQRIIDAKNTHEYNEVLQSLGAEKQSDRGGLDRRAEAGRALEVYRIYGGEERNAQLHGRYAGRDVLQEKERDGWLVQQERVGGQICRGKGRGHDGDVRGAPLPSVGEDGPSVQRMAGHRRQDRA